MTSSARMSRSNIELGEYYDEEKRPTTPSMCTTFLRNMWKTITCLFSHITLVTMVVSYCVLGAFTFEALEVNNEKAVKKNISKLRFNVTNHLWKLTREMDVLEKDNFTINATNYLKEFENSILNAMNKDGWDGIEDVDKVQWTRTGALFYSIIVITTIGYGHISPKTTWGKVATIFYAILGIPLMLLCLSNIGDIMAKSFRFLYWRVCCYMCTKKKKRKKRRRRSRKRKSRSLQRSGSVRSRSVDALSRGGGGVRRSIRRSTRSTDSGFIAYSEPATQTHSDTDLRLKEPISDRSLRRGASLPKMRPSPSSLYKKQHSVPHTSTIQELMLDPLILAQTPILCNRYVTRPFDQKQLHPKTDENKRKDLLQIPTVIGTKKSSPKSHHHRHARRSPRSPKMMTPLGYGHPGHLLDDSSDDSSDGASSSTSTAALSVNTKKPVPIWLCVLLVVSYILAGAFLFNLWETWPLLDAAYFCFITLTTIGFGDLVPAKGVSQDGYRATVSIALCSLYLLFGISLLAMSFNLVQEEVISNVKSVARRLGIIKKDKNYDHDDYDDSESDEDEELEEEVEEEEDDDFDNNAKVGEGRRSKIVAEMELEKIRMK